MSGAGEWAREWERGRERIEVVRPLGARDVFSPPVGFTLVRVVTAKGHLLVCLPGVFQLQVEVGSGRGLGRGHRVPLWNTRGLLPVCATGPCQGHAQKGSPSR